MTTTITGLFDNRSDAMAAVEALHGAGILDDQISIIASNGDGGYRTETASNASEDAGKGAGIGAMVGGAGGLLTGLGIMAIPGVGPVVAAGWLAATAAGAIAGGAVGAAAGGIVGAMTANGEPERDAHVYAEGVRRGASLVSARVEDVDEATARKILGSGKIDVAERDKAYRADGWDGFDEDAPPFSGEQFVEDRGRSPLV
jgi:hypothetical protein